MEIVIILITNIYVQVPHICREDYSINVLGWFGGNSKQSEELMKCWENDKQIGAISMVVILQVQTKMKKVR